MDMTGKAAASNQSLPYETSSEPCSFSMIPSQYPQANFEGSWDCPHPSHEGSDKCVFHMSEDTRSRLGVTERTISESISWEISHSDDGERNEFLGSTIPELSFAYEQVSGNNNIKINLRYSDIGTLSLTSTQLHHGIDLSYSNINSIRGENCTFELDVLAKNTSVINDVFLGECNIKSDFDFSSATIKGDFTLEESDLEDECSFSNCDFEGSVSFQATEFDGISYQLGDLADFNGAKFFQNANFKQTIFECSDFSNAEFKEDCRFTDSTHLSPFRSDNTQFSGEAFFRNSQFKSDAKIRNCSFNSIVDFSGVRFSGKTQSVDADSDFSGTIFNDRAEFERSKFYESSFDSAEFRTDVDFTNSEFVGHNTFQNCTFGGSVRFSESLFNGDVDFSNCTFSEEAIFTGTEFAGDSNHLMYNCIFDKSTFNSAADFHDAIFTRASFSNTEFQSHINMKGCDFNESVEMHFSTTGQGGECVNLTGAYVKGGVIRQSTENNIPYDFTDATLGDIRIHGETNQYQVLDYFRFIETDFDGFDWFEHHDYLERNGWVIHTFNSPANYNPEKEATPRSIQDTYLKAQTNAQQIGDTDAALAFDKKRNQFSRKTLYKLIFDSTEPITLRTRIDKLTSAGVNWIMDVTCGYGSAPGRVALLTFTLPFFYGLLYSLGGPFKTSVGSLFTSGDSTQLAVLFDNIYYSYISFTTIGYGGIGPQGWIAKILAATQGMLNGILFALLIYTLNKQVDK